MFNAKMAKEFKIQQRRNEIRHNNASYSTDEKINYTSIMLSDTEAFSRIGKYKSAAKSFLQAIKG